MWVSYLISLNHFKAILWSNGSDKYEIQSIEKIVELFLLQQLQISYKCNWLQRNMESLIFPPFLCCVVCKIFSTNWLKSGRIFVFFFFIRFSRSTLSLHLFNEGEVNRSCGMHNLFFGLIASSQIQLLSLSTFFKTRAWIKSSKVVLLICWLRTNLKKKHLPFWC